MNAPRSIAAFGSLALLVGLPGCISGTWSLADVEPIAARRDAQFQTMTLEKDGSFYAEAVDDRGIRTTSGTYTYDDGILDLRAHDGERHTYRAKLVSANNLELERTWEGQKMEMEYKRKK